jgi:hypothetical protein
MALPVLNVTIVDGALGIIPPANANAQVKLGISSLALASVAASKLIPSTSGGDGVTFTAKTAGSAGNLITIIYNTPSGGATTVVTSGNLITVSPKAGALNSDIVTAIQANAQANALVSVAAVVAGDAVVAVASTPLVGGTDGLVNTLLSFTDPTTVQNTLGIGPLTDAICHSLGVAGGTCYAMPVLASVAGTNSSVTKNGSAGGGVVSVSGTPYDSYSVIVKPVTTGALGVGTFKYSLDGGVTFSAVYTIPSGGSFAVANTGLTLGFTAATYTIPDYWTFSTVQPGFGISDVQAAINILVGLPTSWSWLHVVGPAATAAGAASLAAAVETLMESAASTKYRYAFAMTECPVDTDANIISAFASFVGNRCMVGAGTVQLLTPSTPNQLVRNVAWTATARMAAVAPSEDLGAVADGSLPGVAAIFRDEFATPALDAVGFTTARTWVGLPGFYLTGGHTFAGVASDFNLIQNRRVMDQACRVARNSLVPVINSTIRTNTNGTIYEKDAQRIEATVGSALGSAIVAPGWATSASVVVDRTNNILATQTLNVTVRIGADGYAKTINLNIGFLNPALQLQAAA